MHISEWWSSQICFCQFTKPHIFHINKKINLFVYVNPCRNWSKLLIWKKITTLLYTSVNSHLHQIPKHPNILLHAKHGRNLPLLIEKASNKFIRLRRNQTFVRLEMAAEWIDRWCKFASVWNYRVNNNLRI